MRLVFSLKALTKNVRTEVFGWMESFKLSRDEWLAVFEECVKHGVELDLSLEKSIPVLIAATGK